MKILAIDTSCDETSCAVTQDTKVLSNVIWSQASLHAKFGGVMPSLAKRMHEERIDWVINKAMADAKCHMTNIDVVAVTVGPGLSIALGVGINKAKELATKYQKRLIAVNHLEGHLLGSLANDKYQMTNAKFPMLGLVISGGNTLLVKIDKIGYYQVLAQTMDDALGEALDKGARMLGLGYPGGAVLEKMANLSRFAHLEQVRFNPYKLPVPIVGQEERQIFTYSGLKTAFSRLTESQKPLSKDKIYNLASSFQNTAFEHLIRIIDYYLTHILESPIQNMLVGGGVSANVEVRNRLRKLGKKHSIKVFFPKYKKLYGDNAAMIGIAAFLNQNFIDPETIDRKPNLKLS